MVWIPVRWDVTLHRWFSLFLLFERPWSIKMEGQRPIETSGTAHRAHIRLGAAVRTSNFAKERSFMCTQLVVRVKITVQSIWHDHSNDARAMYQRKLRCTVRCIMYRVSVLWMWHLVLWHFGVWGSVVVKALRYLSDGPGIDSRWCHWGFFPWLLPTEPCARGSTEPLKMSTRDFS